MNLITHALLGWSAASLPRGLRRGEKAWVVAAAIAPDLDGLGIVAELLTRHSEQPLFWWSLYHHVLGHNLLFAVVLTAAAWAATRRGKVALLVLLSVHLHLLTDLIGSRGPDGYQWPIPYLWPFSEAAQWTVPWQWELNAWPNVAISLALLVHLFWLAWKQGTSPLAFFSSRANEVFVNTLRSRFGAPGRRE